MYRGHLEKVWKTYPVPWLGAGGYVLFVKTLTCRKGLWGGEIMQVVEVGGCGGAKKNPTVWEEKMNAVCP